MGRHTTTAPAPDGRPAAESWATFRAGLKRVQADALRPPPTLLPSAWADEHRMLSREYATEPGHWDTDRAPYQRGFMDACADPEIETVVLMTAAQVGKSEALLNVAGYYIDQDPCPILYVTPSDGFAKSWSQERLAPTIRDTPRLRSRVSDAKSRSSGNRTLLKTFPGGYLAIVGANAPSGLAARPIRVVLLDEVDRFPASAGTEGDPVSLAVKRTTTFDNRVIIMASTPGLKGFSRIEEAYEESDQRQYLVPCPHCDHRQRFIWRRRDADGEWQKAILFAWDPETQLARDAHFVCEGCGVLIPETRKRWMVQRGEWVAQRPGRRVAGFHVSALYSPWVSWDEIATDFMRSKANRERLKVWVQVNLGESWEEGGETVDEGTLLGRRRPAPTRTDEAGRVIRLVPEGVGVLTAAVDVQADRLECLVVGWGQQEQSWRVALESFWGDPARRDVWRTLDAFLAEAFEHEHGAQMAIQAVAVDSGDQTEMVYRFTAPRWRRRVFAVKGFNVPARPILARPTRNNKYRARVFMVGTDTAKDLIFSRLRIKEPGAGYLHFAEWLDEEYFAQLTSERAVPKVMRGRRVRVYEKVRDRNEALDLEVYNVAALVFLGGPTLRRLGILAKRATVRGQREREAAERQEGSTDDAEPERTEAARRRPPSPAAARRTGQGGKGFVGKWRDG